MKAFKLTKNLNEGFVMLYFNGRYVKTMAVYMFTDDAWVSMGQYFLDKSDRVKGVLIESWTVNATIPKSAISNIIGNSYESFLLNEKESLKQMINFL